MAENDILDQHTLYSHTPASSNVFDDLSDGLCDLLATLNDILQDSCANNVAESGLGTLNEGLANIGDSKGSLMRRNDVVVNDGSKAKGDIVLGHAELLWDFGNLNFDIDLNETLAERVDLDQTRVDSLVKATELRNQANIPLVNTLVWVGANDAAGDCAQGTDAGAEGVD